jgi:hypothetical protein
VLTVQTAVVVTSGAIRTAVAQQSEDPLAPGVYERLAFDAAAGFSGLDVDRSGSLTPDELGPHDPELFSRVDRDGDGALSFDEV